MLSRQYLRDVPLPEDITPEDIFSALRGTQEVFALISEKTGLNLSAIIQANNFSGMVPTCSPKS